MKKAPDLHPVSRRLFWLASLMFFLSGGTGLAYQVIWFKRFAHVWGSSSLAFASVGGCFLFGLGVGAWIFGRYADQILAAAAMVWRLRGWPSASRRLALPLEIRWLIDLSAGVYSHLPDEPLLRYLVQFCLTLAVVGPTCCLADGARSPY